MIIARLKLSPFLFLVTSIVLFSTGCTAHYPVNQQISEVNFDTGYRNIEPKINDRSDSLFVGLAFSGGGTRAAAFAYGVLESLRDINIEWEGKHRKLVDEIDIISSVSGGSFTAAYFGLFGNRIFDDFKDKFLYIDVQSRLSMKLWNPLSYGKLSSSAYNRSELAADYYDEVLFEGKTFRDILENGGPIIQINATEIGVGNQFSFMQGYFDLICSDLLDFPISRAITASSAVPVIFTPVTLHNYAGSCNYNLPDWANAALTDNDTSSRRYHIANNLVKYLEREKYPYLHLYDGGLTDNLGIRPLVNRLILYDSAWNAMTAANRRDLKRIIFFIVDAYVEGATEISKKAVNLPLLEIVNRVTSIPLAEYNYETLTTLRLTLQDIESDIKNSRCELQQLENTRLVACDDIKIYIVNLNFDKLKNVELRNEIKRLPTSFSLDGNSVDDLIQAAKLILQESPQLQKFLNELQ